MTVVLNRYVPSAVSILFLQEWRGTVGGIWVSVSSWLAAVLTDFCWSRMLSSRGSASDCTRMPTTARHTPPHPVTNINTSAGNCVVSLASATWNSGQIKSFTTDHLRKHTHTCIYKTPVMSVLSPRAREGSRNKRTINICFSSYNWHVICSNGLWRL